MFVCSCLHSSTSSPSHNYQTSTSNHTLLRDLPNMDSVPKDKPLSLWTAPAAPKNSVMVAVTNPVPPAFHSKPHGTSPYNMMEERKRSFPFLTPTRKKTYRDTDRFIPRRSSIDAFRMSANPETLSPTDRITRKSRSRSPSDFRPAPARRRTGNNSSIAIRTQSGPRRTASGNISGGGVWSLGTTQPLSGPSTRISISLVGETENADEEAIRHQGRVATALGIDRKSRVLTFSGPENQLRRKRSNGFGGGGLMDIWKEGWDIPKPGKHPKTQFA